MAGPGRAELIAVSAGGAIGALLRYGILQVWPTRSGGFPWGTFVINVSGCLLIGALMVLVTHRLARPFLGAGVLGGFTTFSTYADEVRALLRPEWIVVGLVYLVGTVLAALVAVAVGAWVARAVVR